MGSAHISHFDSFNKGSSPDRAYKLFYSQEIKWREYREPSGGTG